MTLAGAGKGGLPLREEALCGGLLRECRLLFPGGPRGFLFREYPWGSPFALWDPGDLWDLLDLLVFPLLVPFYVKQLFIRFVKHTECQKV